MSAKGSGTGLSEGTRPLSSGQDDPATLLGKVLPRANQKLLVDQLVAYLQNPSYSVIDLLRDTAERKKKLVLAGMPAKQLADRWARLDRTVEDCVAQALVPHEKFIDSTLHAFCELDQSGVITFANAKMNEWAPGCIGKEFAPLFGEKADEMRQALAASGPRRLHQVDLESGEKRYTVLVELGLIEAEGPTSGYAFLVDMSELVDAEHKAIEAAPNGMLKLDAEYRILYANTEALKLFELTLEELTGRYALDFVEDEASRQEVMRQLAERSSGQGGQYEILFTQPKSRSKINLKITSVPSFNPAGAFSGTLASLQPIDHEIARKKIARLVAAETDYKKLFQGIVEIIKPFVPFDWADLSLYTENRDYAFSFCRYPPGSDEYKIRWWPIAPKDRQWIERDLPVEPDMLAYMNATPEGRRALENDDELKRTMTERRAIIGLPVWREGKIIGALSLTSKDVCKYDKKSFETLTLHLAVDQALQAVFNLRTQARRKFVLDLLTKISAAADHKKLADTIVRELASFYEFQNVSIFKVNELRGHLSLLAQSPLGPLGGTAIRSDYTQPFSEGVLGLSYRTSKPVNMKDRHDGSEAAKAFKQVAPETVSELCIPITLRGRILWILNLEDSRRNAFADREIDTLKNIVDQVDKVVDHLFEGQVLNQVLDEFPDGVVIARKGGGVLRCNNEAQRIFELDSAVPDAPLSSFLAPDDLAIALSEQNSPPWKTQVRGTRGKETPVLISKFLLPDEYDHVVLQLQDTTELQWKSDIERLNAALADAASQVRVPLSLVSSYVQQIGRKANDGVLADLVAKTARQLSRIELTYDRVFASYDANKLPNERKIPVEINRILAHILGELSASDRAAVKVACGEAAIWVLADSYRLLFALESMLTYLLHCRANSNEITVDVASVNKKYAEIVMAGSVSTIEPNGALEKIVEATRMEIALGERLLKQIGTECGGAFERRQQPGREQLLLRLKLKP